MQMSQELYDALFLFFFGVLLLGFIWMPLTWLLLSIFTPKKLLDRYFKEPHFTLTETIMMREFPGFLFRTSIFGWAILVPSLDRKRNIKNVIDYIPAWYAILLKMLTIGALFIILVIAIFFPLLLISDPQ